MARRESPLDCLAFVQRVRGGDGGWATARFLIGAVGSWIAFALTLALILLAFVSYAVGMDLPTRGWFYMYSSWLPWAACFAVTFTFSDEASTGGNIAARTKAFRGKRRVDLGPSPVPHSAQMRSLPLFS